MALPVKLIAAIATTTAVAGAGVYLAINSPDAGSAANGGGSGPTPFANGTPGPSAADAGSHVTLCLGADRILRVAPGFAEDCPSGQREFLLEEADEQVCELCDPFKEPDPPASADKAVAEIERRIRRLENPTYFAVTTQRDEPIFQVGRGGVRMLNPQQHAVAFVGTPDEGAFFTARSPAGMEASLAAAGNNVGVLLGDMNANRIELGTRNAGWYALRFPSGKGLLAGIGQSRAGTGAVLVGTLPGVTQGSITVTDGRGMFSLTKDGKPGGLAIAEATIGGGLFDLGNDAGDTAVKMGHNGHRYGIVLTGPVPGLPYVPRSGLPGSYFMGCASGEAPACMPTVP